MKVLRNALLIVRPSPIEFNANRMESGIGVPSSNNDVQLNAIRPDFPPEVSGLGNDIQVDVPISFLALILADVNAVEVPSDAGSQIQMGLRWPAARNGQRHLAHVLTVRRWILSEPRQTDAFNQDLRLLGHALADSVSHPEPRIGRPGTALRMTFYPHPYDLKVSAIRRIKADV